MISRSPLPDPTPLRQEISALYRADEATIVRKLTAEAEVADDVRARITDRARELVEAVRAQRLEEGGMDAFMDEYELSSGEGVVLMCLAEALLRIPDADTADKLIKDKIGSAKWEKHLGHSHSWFVNASTWALMLTGRVLRLSDDKDSDLGGILGRLVARSGEPVIRQALLQAMRILGRQFVMGRTIGEALDRARAMESKGYRYSYDMLGEAAHTAEDAQRYLEAYDAVIAAIGAAANGRGPIEAPGLSVKLSALHPRYEMAQRERVLAELTPRLTALARHAAKAGIGLTVDAEEADRLDLSLEIFERVAMDPATAGWHGFGLAVQ
ncbi:MAG: proline dehydrogenase family protein, partial [Bauldia litoralis]